MNRRQVLKATPLLFPAGCLGVSNQTQSGGRDERLSYTDLLATFPNENVGYDYGHGGDADDLGKRHWPMVYSLVSGSEARRAVATGSDQAAARASAAARWLYKHRDRNNNGQVGWGLPVTADAGSNGVTNPRHTEYAITTALAVQALLDVVDLYERRGDTFSKRRTYLRAAEAALAPYVNEYYNSYEYGRCFWYSLREADSYDVLNASVMVAGQCQRLLGYEQETGGGVARAADEAVAYILELATSINVEGVFWPYWGTTPAEGAPEEMLNDAVHYSSEVG